MKRRIQIVAKFFCRILIRWFGLGFVEDETKRLIEDLSEISNARESQASASCSESDIIKTVASDGEKITDCACNFSSDVLIGEMQKQDLFRGLDLPSIREIYNLGVVNFYDVGEELASQGADGDEVFFILEGKVSIEVNQIPVDTSSGGECVGEMVLFNRLSRRSATLLAVERCVVFVICAAKLKTLILNRPKGAQLLYNIASVLSDRLRKREWLCRLPNKIPRVFIGSSTEAKSIAKCVDTAIRDAGVGETKVWTDIDMFSPSSGLMEDIEKWVSQCDFAVLILSKDDYLKSRNKEYCAPRDNVVFELGYCMGKLGRERAMFMLQDANKPHPTKTPSDISGLTYISFKRSKTSYDGAVKKILRKINDMGVRK